MVFEYQSDPRRGLGLRGRGADRVNDPVAPARLRARAPEDRVEIVVMREGERVTLPVVAGHR